MQERTDAKLLARPSRNAGQMSLRSACNEIANGIRGWEFWLTLAWVDTLARYRRTLLGPFWTTLNSTIFVVILAFVYALLWRVELKTFLPFVAAGYFTWIFFSTCLNESCSLFHTYAETLKTAPIPPISLLLRLLARNLINFLHNLIVFIGLALIFGLSFRYFPLSLVGIAILGAFCLGCGMVLAILCSRYRDFEQIISNLLTVLFFVTPILWQPRLLPAGSALLADANIVFHLISIVRQPMLGQMPAPHSYVIATVAAAAALALGVLCYARYRRRLAYWL
jgi:ABC-type polysaccharide/polyol phosphate export permease